MGKLDSKYCADSVSGDWWLANQTTEGFSLSNFHATIWKGHPHVIIVSIYGAEPSALAETEEISYVESRTLLTF
jgi:hypothetical protein